MISCTISPIKSHRTKSMKRVTPQCAISYANFCRGFQWNNMEKTALFFLPATNLTYKPTYVYFTVHCTCISVGIYSYSVFFLYCH